MKPKTATVSANRWHRGATLAVEHYADGMLHPRNSRGPLHEPETVEIAKTDYLAGTISGREKYMRSMAPYFAILKRIMLPPRRPKGHPGNFRRSQVVYAALHQERVRRMPSAQRAMHKQLGCHMCSIRVRLRPAQ